MESAHLQTFEGRPSGKGRRIAIAVARFNGEVTSKLEAGAVAALREAGVAEDDLVVVRVPGAFELPLVCQRFAASGRFDAVVALGAVIRGETSHYDHVCSTASQGVLQASLATGVPVLFGVLTCDTDAQAEARAGGAHGNKGADVALDALRMADLLARMPRRADARAEGGAAR
jgi:6,7-dimethyl-8-ribityllumazine synthase